MDGNFSKNIILIYGIDMKKYINIVYLLPLMAILIILIGIMGCDNTLGSPDIRKEFTKSTKPDFFGWKWNFKW